MNRSCICCVMAICAVVQFCGATPPSILSVVATNALSTWEGVFRFRDIHPVELEGEETAFLAIYSNATPVTARYDARLDGTLIELFKDGGDEAVRLLTAGEQKDGCAPHILAFGDILPPANRYWTIWRDIAPGAHLYYERYSYTNGILKLTDLFAFTGIKPDLRWYRDNGSDYLETLPLDFSDHHIIWRNTNTLYKLEAYDFNFPAE